jgi:hypothetical protein
MHSEFHNANLPKSTTHKYVYIYKYIWRSFVLIKQSLIVIDFHDFDDVLRYQICTHNVSVFDTDNVSCSLQNVFPNSFSFHEYLASYAGVRSEGRG